MLQLQKLNLKPLITRILKVLSNRNGSILALRHGVGSGKKNTLESIGQKYNITRERVRQIEEASYYKIRNSNEFDELQPAFATVEDFLSRQGGVAPEDILMQNLVIKSQQPYLSLLLALNKSFVKVLENDDFKTLWAINKKSADIVYAFISSVAERVDKLGSPLNYEDLQEILNEEDAQEILTPESDMQTVLAVSKKLQKGPFGQWGLSNWPQINPKGVRDKAHLVMEKYGKPLHFRELAKKIDEDLNSGSNKKTHPQTAHNELIKDDRFVLIGRGTYALADWGYIPGTVKDVIIHVLQEEGNALQRDELVKRVMQQRKVQENTISFNLQNRNFFQKEKNKYYLA